MDSLFLPNFSLFVKPVVDDQKDEMNFQEDQVDDQEDEMNFQEDFQEDQVDDQEDEMSFQEDFQEDQVDDQEDETNFQEDQVDDQEDEMNFQEDQVDDREKLDDQLDKDFDENLVRDEEDEDYNEDREEDADYPNNEEYTNGEGTLDDDNQTSDETDNKNVSTENPIAPNSEWDNASSDAKEPTTEQTDGPPDVLKDAKQWEDDQKTASDTLMETKQQMASDEYKDTKQQAEETDQKMASDENKDTKQQAEDTEKMASDTYKDTKQQAEETQKMAWNTYKDTKQQMEETQKMATDKYKETKKQVEETQKVASDTNNVSGTTNKPFVASNNNNKKKKKAADVRQKAQQKPQGLGQQPSQRKLQQKPQGLGQQESQEEPQENKVSDTIPNIQLLPQQQQLEAQAKPIHCVQEKVPKPQPQPETQTQAISSPLVQEKMPSPSGGVVPTTPTPEEDAAKLYRAFKGNACDVGQLVQILSKHDPTHRLQIAKHYRKSYHEELSDRISSELSSFSKGFLKEKVGLDLSIKATGSLGWLCKDIKRVISLWLLEESERDATIVRQSLQLMSLDKAALTEVICSRTPSQLRNLKRAYFSYFKSELSKDITSSTPLINSNTKELLVACLDDKARDEQTNVDVNKAKEDAKQLFKDGKKILWGTNNKTFIDIFTRRNRPHLAAVDVAYDKLYGHSLEEAVRKETSGSFKDGLLTLLKCAKNPAKYFAEVLYNSMEGLRTSDTTLIRVVVTRADIDMEDIKKEYVQAYKTSLKNYIHDDTSGDYRTFLLNLVE